MCGTSGDEGRFVNFTLKRGGVSLRNEWGLAERHRYFNDREKLLKEKDLRIFVLITEKAYFLKMLYLISPDAPFNIENFIAG